MPPLAPIRPVRCAPGPRRRGRAGSARSRRSGSSPDGSRSSSTIASRRFDVGPRRVLEGGRGVQPLAQLAGLLDERRVDEVRPSTWRPTAGQERDRGRRIRTGDVVRDLGVVAAGRHAGCPRPTTRARRSPPTAPAGCRPDPAPRRRAGARAATSSPRTLTARVWGTAAGIAPRLIQSATSSSRTMLDHVGGELCASGSPARRPTGRGRSWPATRRWRSVRPGQVRSARPAIVDLERRAAAAVVEQGVGVEVDRRSEPSPARLSAAVEEASPASIQLSNAATSTGVAEVRRAVDAVGHGRQDRPNRRPRHARRPARFRWTSRLGG